MKQLLLIAIVAISAAPAFGQGQSAGVRKVIEANTKAFMAAFNRGDAAAVAAMYAIDAKVLPPNGEIVEGRQNIQAFWQNLISVGAKLQALDTVEVDALGNLAYELGKYTLMIPQAGGQSTTDLGKYVVIWKRQGRRWQLAVDIWNTSMPAPGQ